MKLRPYQTEATGYLRLRPYQERFYRRILKYIGEGEDKIFVNSGTGTGKTTVGLAVSAGLKRDVEKYGITGALVVVPQRQIGDGFNLTTDIEVPGRGKRSMVLRHGGVCRVVSGKQVDAIVKHLRAKEPQDDFAIVSSHAALVALFKAGRLPRDLTGKLLILDEAHHASTRKETNAISEVVAEWVRRGGKVLAFSATPTRHDGAPVHDDDWVVMHRTTATHTADRDEHGKPYVPQRHNIEWLPLKGLKAKSLKEILGDEAADSDGTAERQIVKDWIKRGRPKTGIVVPAKGSRATTDRLKKYLSKAGARVLDAVGTDAETKRRVRAALASEKKVTRFKDSTIDVVIACRRLDEGTDWKLCSHIYVMGMPSSIPRAMQQWGRTMRRKDIEGHTHPDEAVIVFLVPDFTADVGASMDASQHKHHREFSTLMACYLDCYQTAQAYTAADIVREAGAKRKKADPDERMERLADAIEMNEEQRARAAADLLALGAKAGKRTPKPLFDAIVEKADTWDDKRVFAAMCLWFERFINHKSLDEKTRARENVRAARASDDADSTGGQRVDVRRGR